MRHNNIAVIRNLIKMFFMSLISSITKIKPRKATLKAVTKLGSELYLDKFSVAKFATAPICLAEQRETKTGSTEFNQFKAQILLSLDFKSNEDSLPFLKLPLNQLQMIQKVTENDKKEKFCDNRLYYIASKIKCPPSAVSKQLAKRTFVYSLSFDWMEKSLNTLLERGVTGDRILRDLWVLKYSHKTISKRLQKIQEMGIDVLYPWMVRCTPNILERYINLTQETKNILGESKSTQMYLAERLNISKEAVEDMWIKIPALRTIRVTKIKKFLDFLIDEGFTVDDIATRPRVLASSQKTIKYRLDKLRSIGLQNINLNSLCRSRKNFQKYFESVRSILKDSQDNFP